MALTKKQIKQLRAMANSLKPLFYVGKNDLTESAVNQADETIEKHELIKCAVQDGSGLTAKEAAAELAEQLNAEVVQSIGNRFVPPLLIFAQRAPSLIQDGPDDSRNNGQDQGPQYRPPETVYEDAHAEQTDRQPAGESHEQPIDNQGDQPERQNRKRQCDQMHNRLD